MIKDLSQRSLRAVLADCTLVDEIVGSRAIRGITDWILKPEILREYKETWTRPEIPVRLGSCWVLLKLNVEADSIFRPACILPLIWKKDAAKSDERLPVGLRELAEDVKKNINGGDASSWTLHAGLSEIPDLSGLMSEENSQSAWFALYAGLRLAMDGLLPNPKIFASGAWKDGVQAVEGLEEKARVAREWGAEKFFIPEQCPLPDGWPQGFAQKVRNDTKLSKALAEYLSDLADEPNEDSANEILDHFYAYLKGAGKHDRAQDFYIRKITRRLVESEPNQKTKQKFSQYTKKATLIVWVSNGWEIILNDARIFDASKVVLLLDGDRFEKAAKTLKQKLEEENIQVEIERNSPRFSEETGSWGLTSGTDFIPRDGTLIFDLTLGTVIMSLVLQNIPDIDPLFLYWEKQVDANNAPIPSTSRLIAWK